MNRYLRGFGAIALSAVAGIGLLFAMTNVSDDATLNSLTGNAERGAYLAVLGDCVACHTKLGDGKPFTGGRGLKTPFGTIYTPNLTPDLETGTGGWTNAQFVTAMRSGVAPGGRRLYPALPYNYFRKATTADLIDLKAFIHSLTPVHAPKPANDLLGPLEFRPLMRGWNLLFREEGIFKETAGKSEAWNRGAYIVEGLGHCGACHTPKNVLGAAKKGVSFTGGDIEGWHALPLDDTARSGLGDWSMEDIVAYLKTGTNGRVFASGPMREVVERSTQHMSNDDLKAIATYLKDLPGNERAGSRSEAAAVIAASDTRMSLGQQVYIDNCSGCHRENGTGMKGIFPALAASPEVQAPKPTSVVRVILDGATEASTSQRPNRIQMPAFNWKLSDEQIAAVATYVRNTWGYKSSQVEPAYVSTARRDLSVEFNQVGKVK